MLCHLPELGQISGQAWQESARRGSVELIASG